MKEKVKNPDRVKGGRARWLSMSAEQRKAFTSAAGKKGGAAFWKKIRELEAKSGNPQVG